MHRSTVAARFGKHEPLTKQRVTEAQVAVSQYVASKHVTGKTVSHAAERLGAWATVCTWGGGGAWMGSWFAWLGAWVA